MLIDPVPLFSQISITLGFNDNNEMDGSFFTQFLYFIKNW